MTTLDPPPGLLDKMAEALDRVPPRSLTPEVAARAAWDAVAEGLGLEWQRGSDEVPGRSRWRHLVSRWEPQP